MSQEDWFAETVGPCPHDLIRPYCPQCVGDELETKREEERRESGEKALRKRVFSLEATVERQSKALSAAYSDIRALERRSQERRPRRSLGGGRDRGGAGADRGAGTAAFRPERASATAGRHARSRRGQHSATPRSCSSSKAGATERMGGLSRSRGRGERRDARRTAEGQTRRLHAAISQLAARHEFAIRTTWSGQDGGASASWWRSSAGRPDRTPSTPPAAAASRSRPCPRPPGSGR